MQTGATAPDRIMQWVEFDRLGERVARRSIPMAEHAPLSPNQYDEYTYDKMGRLVSHKTPWHAETTYAYRGRRVRIEGPAATTDIVNDPLGRPVGTLENATALLTEGNQLSGTGVNREQRDLTEPIAAFLRDIESKTISTDHI